jgi:hypothetical protein
MGSLSLGGRQSARSRASDFLLIPSSRVHQHDSDLVMYVRIGLDFNGFALRINVMSKFGVRPAARVERDD